MKSITIGVTSCSKFDNYRSWIHQEPEVSVVQLGYEQNNFGDIVLCDGILLTGGEDVHPRLYGRPEYLEYCNLYDMNERRDAFEWKVLEYSQQNFLPVLGICRGLQIANVFFGGTLIPDIPSFGKLNHSKMSADQDRVHSIDVDANSLLAKITDEKSGEVNSAHHQSADMIADGLIANAVSHDGVIEGLERIAATGKPWLMLVQWHPERMADAQSVFSKNVKGSFIEACRQRQL